METSKPLPRAVRKLLVLVLALTTGCISIRGGDVPLQPRDKLAAPAPVAASYQLEWLTFGTPKPLLATTILEDVFVNEARASGLFSSLTSEPAAYQIKVTVKNTGNIAVALLTGVLSGLSLTVIPGYARDDYEMIVSVSQQNTVVKEYRLNDHVTSVTQLFLIFAMPFNNRRGAQKEVLRNMTWGVLRQMAGDKIFNAAPAQPDAQPAQPDAQPQPNPQPSQQPVQPVQPTVRPAQPPAVPAQPPVRPAQPPPVVRGGFYCATFFCARDRAICEQRRTEAKDNVACALVESSPSAHCFSLTGGGQLCWRTADECKKRRAADGRAAGACEAK